MGLPWRALFNPGFDQGDLRRLEVLVLLLRRHDVVLIRRGDALVERTLIRLALDDGGAFLLAVLLAGGEKAGLGVKPQSCLARAGIRSMAMKACFRENGTDIAVEQDLCGFHRWADREGTDGGEKNGSNVTH